MTGNGARQMLTLEELSLGNSKIHGLNPVVKLLVTAVFIITAVSFDRYAFGRLAPYIFYPAVIAALSDTPYAVLFKRFLAALPFGVFAGVSGAVFDTSFAFCIAGIPVTYGAVSFFVIILKMYLCVTAAVLFVSVTPFTEITDALGRIKVPSVFIVIFEMTYRYIGVLLDEAYSMYTAYSLRSKGRGGIRIRDMGPFAGQLLLRSLCRAERVYDAMKCRGYSYLRDASRPIPSGLKWQKGDFIFASVTGVLCVCLRFFNPGSLIAAVLGEGK